MFYLEKTLVYLFRTTQRSSVEAFSLQPAVALGHREEL